MTFVIITTVSKSPYAKDIFDLNLREADHNNSLRTLPYKYNDVLDIYEYKCNVNLIHPFGLVSVETTSFKILLGVRKQFSPAYVRIFDVL